MAEYEFLELMPDVVTIERRTMASANGYPAGEYAAPKQYPCLIESEPRLIRTLEGNERVSSAQVIVATDWLLVNGVPVQQAPDLIGAADRLTLPVSGQTPIMHVDQVHDQHGLHHTVIYA